MYKIVRRDTGAPYYCVLTWICHRLWGNVRFL